MIGYFVQPLTVKKYSKCKKQINKYKYIDLSKLLNKNYVVRIRTPYFQNGRKLRCAF